MATPIWIQVSFACHDKVVCRLWVISMNTTSSKLVAITCHTICYFNVFLWMISAKSANCLHIFLTFSQKMAYLRSRSLFRCRSQFWKMVIWSQWSANGVGRKPRICFIDLPFLSVLIWYETPRVSEFIEEHRFLHWSLPLWCLSLPTVLAY